VRQNIKAKIIITQEIKITTTMTINSEMNIAMDNVTARRKSLLCHITRDIKTEGNFSFSHLITFGITSRHKKYENHATKSHKKRNQREIDFSFSQNSKHKNQTRNFL
jgi:hypothetical protein